MNESSASGLLEYSSAFNLYGYLASVVPAFEALGEPTVFIFEKLS